MNLAAWAQGSRAAATINSRDGEPICERGLGGGLGVFAGYEAGARPLQKGDL